MDGGAWTLEARVEGPTLTLPSHVTMVTGLPASTHGVTWNDSKPDRGSVVADTLFDVVRRAGFKSALVYGKKKFQHFTRPGSPSDAIFVDGTAQDVAAAGVPFLRDRACALVMVHFAQGDAAGHDFGWGNEAKGSPPSQELLESFRECDAGLGTLLEACRRSGWERTLVLVTADHGGHDKTHGSDDAQDVLIPWVAGGGLAEHVGELEGAVQSTDTAPTILRALGLSFPATIAGKPVECLRGEARKAA